MASMTPHPEPTGRLGFGCVAPVWVLVGDWTAELIRGIGVHLLDMSFFMLFDALLDVGCTEWERRLDELAVRFHDEIAADLAIGRHFLS